MSTGTCESCRRFSKRQGNKCEKNSAAISSSYLGATAPKAKDAAVFRVLGLRVKVWGLGFRAKGLGCPTAKVCEEDSETPHFPLTVASHLLQEATLEVLQTRAHCDVHDAVRDVGGSPHPS